MPRRKFFTSRCKYISLLSNMCSKSWKRQCNKISFSTAQFPSFKHSWKCWAAWAKGLSWWRIYWLFRSQILYRNNRSAQNTDNTPRGTEYQYINKSLIRYCHQQCTWRVNHWNNNCKLPNMVPFATVLNNNCLLGTITVDKRFDFTRESGGVLLGEF